MDVFTGAGEVVTTRPGDDLFDAFPNSYGSLGYATRLRIELEPIRSHVALRHVRFDDAGLLAKTIAMITETGEYAGEQVDGIDGVAFEPGEYYLTLARWSDYPGGGGEVERLHRPADLLPVDPAARDRPADDLRLPVALGHRLVLVLGSVRRPEPPPAQGLAAQVPPLRRLLPDGRLGPPLPHRRPARQARRAARSASGSSRTSRSRSTSCPSSSTGSTPRSACARCGCARSSCGEREWPTYPLTLDTTYVNVGFWGTVHVGPDRENAPKNRAIEAKVHELGGHKSLYSEAFYDRETFDRLYDGEHLAAVKADLRPRQPADEPLRQGGAQAMSHHEDRRRTRDAAHPGAARTLHGVRRQLGRHRRGRHHAAPEEPARPGLPAHRARRPRPGPRLRDGRPRHPGRPPGRPLRRAGAALPQPQVPAADAGRGLPDRPRPGLGQPQAAARAAAGDAAALAPYGRGPAPLDGPRRRRDPATTTTSPTASTRWCWVRR